jgi:hypothetical protein
VGRPRRGRRHLRRHRRAGAERVESWKRLEAEAEAAALRAVPHEQRRRDKRFSRITKDAQKRKGR